LANLWRVLIVDDDYDSVRMVSKILTFHGAEVHVAHNGEECLEMLGVVNPSLIVTDLAMPDMDGWQTLIAVRSRSQTAHIPVVAITSYDSVLVAEKVMDAGFDAYFAKPLNPRTFVENLAKLIEG
jgi:CheY-like chemotaxis protein